MSVFCHSDPCFCPFGGTSSSQYPSCPVMSLLSPSVWLTPVRCSLHLYLSAQCLAPAPAAAPDSIPHPPLQNHPDCCLRFVPCSPRYAHCYPFRDSRTIERASHQSPLEFNSYSHPQRLMSDITFPNTTVAITSPCPKPLGAHPGTQTTTISTQPASPASCPPLPALCPEIAFTFLGALTALS